MEELDKFYKSLVIKKSEDSDIIFAAINITQKYIINNNKILVGGQAIHYALRLKENPGIYMDDAIPDLDMISDTHFKDAYKIAIILKRAGFENISVINALHPSTMRIRINFNDICDITYVPKNIIENIPTLKYKGFTIIHPHMQMIDQHRALSYPYENAPLETILHRSKKDMVRYDTLYEYYPIKLLSFVPKNKYDSNSVHIELVQKYINTKILKDQCISGYAALNYWVEEARKLGFKPNINLGSIKLETAKLESNMQILLPFDYSNIVIYTNNIKDLYEQIQKEMPDTNALFYNKFLDKLPKKISIGSYEIYDNQQKIAAYYDTKYDTYIANLQHVMMYILLQYSVISKMNNKQRSYSLFAGYNLCRNIIKWVNSQCVDKIDIKFKKFYPTAQVYGDNNLNDATVVKRAQFNLKNTAIDVESEMEFNYSQPKAVYDRDLLYGKIPQKYYEFDISKSEIYNIDGNQINSFLV